MTQDDQEKCAEVWEEITGLKTMPNMWCEKSADILAELIAEVMNCSKAFSYVPKPPGSRPGSGWFLGYAYQVLKNRYLTGGYTCDACKTVVFSKYRQAIEISFLDCP